MNPTLPHSYVTRRVELEKFDRMAIAKGEQPTGEGVYPLIANAACGDKNLFDALWSFWNFSQAFDDLIDESGVSGDEKELAFACLHDVVVALLLRPMQSYSGKFNQWREAIDVFDGVWVRLVNQCHWQAEQYDFALEAKNYFFDQLQRNPFIGRNACEVRAMFVQAMLRCLDGDEMEQSGIPERVALAPAVRCGDLEVLFHMIYLSRGWAAARAWSSRRDYDTGKEIC